MFMYPCNLIPLMSDGVFAVMFLLALSLMCEGKWK